MRPRGTARRGEGRHRRRGVARRGPIRRAHATRAGSLVARARDRGPSPLDVRDPRLGDRPRADRPRAGRRGPVLYGVLRRDAARRKRTASTTSPARGVRTRGRPHRRILRGRVPRRGLDRVRIPPGRPRDDPDLPGVLPGWPDPRGGGCKGDDRVDVARPNVSLRGSFPAAHPRSEDRRPDAALIPLLPRGVRRRGDPVSGRAPRVPRPQRAPWRPPPATGPVRVSSVPRRRSEEHLAHGTNRRNRTTRPRAAATARTRPDGRIAAPP